MKRRRPEQRSMLALMGSAELEKPEPFAGSVITRLVTERVQRNSDEEFEHVLEATVVGPDYPEEDEAGWAYWLSHSSPGA